MKTVSTDLAAHLAGEVTTLATCWKLTRRDATVMGFTDHDQNLTLDGVTYVAATGFTASAVATSGSLSVDNLDVEGMLSDEAITQEDVTAGKYDFAEIEVFKVNYADLSQGTLPLRRGWLGEVTMSRGQFVAEVRGLTQRLSQTTGELYAPACRAKLGDARCKIDMTARTHSGVVTSASGNLAFTDTSRGEADGTFTFGSVTFTGGANSGLAMEVKEHTGHALTLALPLPGAIAAGDTYTIREGCDKSFATCRDRFNNVLNFRGEPDVPGLDKILETAGTKSEW